MERRWGEPGIASLTICETRVRGLDFVIRLVDLARESDAVSILFKKNSPEYYSTADNRFHASMGKPDTRELDQFSRGRGMSRLCCVQVMEAKRACKSISTCLCTWY